MSKDYESYSEYRKKQKKRKANYVNMGILALIVLLIGGGLFWLGSWLYGFISAKSDKSEIPAKPAQATQEVKSEASANKGETASKSETADAKAVTGAEALFGDAKYLIHIHKKAYKLELFEKGKAEPIKTYSVAIAKNDGDKKRPGDNTTPTSWGNAVAIPKSYKDAKYGVDSAKVPFRVEEIVDASSWSHDFRDGKGVIPHAYGPWFISIDTGWDGIGIHGTHDPNSIGTKASEGCIRLLNNEVDELKKIIYSHNRGIGTRVIITEE